MVILHGQIWAQLRVQRMPEIEIEGYPMSRRRRPG